MGRFAVRSLLFLLPLLLYFSIPFLLLNRSGESASVERVVLFYEENPDGLYGTAYDEQTPAVKLEMTRRHRASVLALGTSRVMQFRREMFSPDSSFYNAGGAVSTPWGFEVFWDRLSDEEKPSILILGLDQYFFNDRWSAIAVENEGLLVSAQQSTFRAISHTDLVLARGAKVWRDLIRGKVQWPRDIPEDALGLNAVVNGSGFRRDGSRDYGAGVDRGPRTGFSDTLGRIAKGRKRFEFGDEVSPRSMGCLQKFLARCVEDGVHVVGFIPPVAPVIHDALVEHRDRYQYMFQLDERLRPLFEDQDFEFYDFGEAASLGASDEEFIDGFHGSDRTYARVLAEICRSGSRLAPYVDPEAQF